MKQILKNLSQLNFNLKHDLILIVFDTKTENYFEKILSGLC